MKFFNALFIISGNISNSLAKGTRSFFESLSRLQINNSRAKYNQQVNKSDQEKIASDFRRIGKDMYVALDKYRAKNGY